MSRPSFHELAVYLVTRDELVKLLLLLICTFASAKLVTLEASRGVA